MLTELTDEEATGIVGGRITDEEWLFIMLASCAGPEIGLVVAIWAYTN